MLILPSVGFRKASSQSSHAVGDWNRDWRSVCAEMRRAARRCRAGVRKLVYGCHVHVTERRAMSFAEARDRKSTRLNSSHTVISYAVFCLKKKNFVSRVLPKKIRSE